MNGSTNELSDYTLYAEIYLTDGNLEPVTRLAPYIQRPDCKNMFGFGL